MKHSFKDILRKSKDKSPSDYLKRTNYQSLKKSQGFNGKSSKTSSVHSKLSNSIKHPRHQESLLLRNVQKEQKESIKNLMSGRLTKKPISQKSSTKRNSY